MGAWPGRPGTAAGGLRLLPWHPILSPPGEEFPSPVARCSVSSGAGLRASPASPPVFWRAPPAPAPRAAAPTWMCDQLIEGGPSVPPPRTVSGWHENAALLFAAARGPSPGTALVAHAPAQLEARRQDGPTRGGSERGCLHATVRKWGLAGPPRLLPRAQSARERGRAPISPPQWHRRSCSGELGG